MSLIPKRGTVYVVDDDEAVRDSLQWLLEGKDYRVKCFDSAESFLARFDPREVACLIADIHMPAMTGLELYRRLLDTGQAIPTILVTAYPNDTDRACAESDGVLCYLRKPVNEDVLIECLRAALASGATREQDS